jgi:hypothetical protein
LLLSQQMEDALSKNNFNDRKIFKGTLGNLIAFSKDGAVGIMNETFSDIKIFNIKDLMSMKLICKDNTGICSITTNDFDNPCVDIILGYYHDTSDKENIKEKYNEIKSIYSIVKKQNK